MTSFAEAGWHLIRRDKKGGRLLYKVSVFVRGVNPPLNRRTVLWAQGPVKSY